MTIKNEISPEKLHSMVNSCLELTQMILKDHRFRIAGTDGCREAADKIAEVFGKFCDRVEEEPFILYPKALWYVGRVIALIYLVSAVIDIMGNSFIYIGSILCFIGMFYGLIQYVFYGRLFDRLFKSAEGRNVTATLEPDKNVKVQIILVGHHDSPYIFSFLERFQSIAFIRFLFGMLSYIWLTAYSCWLSIHHLISGNPESLSGVGLWITVFGLFFAFQLFFMMSRKPSPGAGDNLNSVSMLVTIADYFQMQKHHNSPLSQTRLIFLSTDGEEIGQRGAIAYVEKHGVNLHQIPTFVLNIDSIFNVRDLTIFTRDRNSTCKLSSTMTFDLSQLAGEQGMSIKCKSIPFGGGGTDAAAFAVEGIQAASIVGVPSGIISKGHLYHTSQDIVENIKPDAVESVLQLAIRYIKKIDNQETVSFPDEMS